MTYFLHLLYFRDLLDSPIFILVMFKNADDIEKREHIASANKRWRSADCREALPQVTNRKIFVFFTGTPLFLL